MKTLNAMTTLQALDLYARQWGATAIPFAQLNEQNWLETPQTQRAAELLNQTALLRGVMLLAGPNGVGKSVLMSRWLRQLDNRLFHPLVLTHATLTGSSVLAALTLKLGKPAGHRRERNLQSMEEALAELERKSLVVVLDEAQNYSTMALEEVRLLLGLNLPLRHATPAPSPGPLLPHQLPSLPQPLECVGSRTLLGKKPGGRRGGSPSLRDSRSRTARSGQRRLAPQPLSVGPRRLDRSSRSVQSVR